METDKDIHFLMEYDTTDRVCDIVKIIKQEVQEKKYILIRCLFYL